MVLGSKDPRTDYRSRDGNAAAIALIATTRNPRLVRLLRSRSRFFLPRRVTWWRHFIDVESAAPPVKQTGCARRLYFLSFPFSPRMYPSLSTCAGLRALPRQRVSLPVPLAFSITSRRCYRFYLFSLCPGTLGSYVPRSPEYPTRWKHATKTPVLLSSCPLALFPFRFVLRSAETGTPGAYVPTRRSSARTSWPRDGKVHWALHFLHRRPAPRAHLHTHVTFRTYVHDTSIYPSISFPPSYSPSLSFLCRCRSFTLHVRTRCPSPPITLYHLSSLSAAFPSSSRTLPRSSHLLTFPFLSFSPLAVHSRSTCRLPAVSQVSNFFPSRPLCLPVPSSYYFH